VANNSSALYLACHPPKGALLPYESVNNSRTIQIAVVVPLPYLQSVQAVSKHSDKGCAASKLKALVSQALSKLQHPFSTGFQFILNLPKQRQYKDARCATSKIRHVQFRNYDQLNFKCVRFRRHVNSEGGQQFEGTIFGLYSTGGCNTSKF